MSILKRLIFLTTAVIMGLCSVLPVSADELISDNTVIVEQQEEASEPIEPDYENDPMYLKYMNQPMTTAIYGASGLVHNSRFDNVKKVYGVDVSYFNSTIDWEKVKASGIDFVIVRLGYRGYSNGALVTDVKFNENVTNAKKAGVAVGVYFFTQAISTAEAKEEAEYVLDRLDGIKLEMPVYIDIEEVSYGDARLDNANLSYDAKTRICKTFCDTVADGGYRAGVYASKNWLTNLMDGEYLSKYHDIWVAQYNTQTTYEYDYSMWQYSGQGYVDGISTYVDMNVLYLNKAPSKVTTLSASANTGSRVKLTWEESFGAYGYEIYVKNMATGTVESVGQTTSTSKTVTIPYAASRFFVKAYYKINDNYSYSPYSNGVTVYSKQVTDITVSSRKQNYLTLTWTALSDANGYEVQMYNTEAGEYEIIGYTNQNFFKAENLEMCTEYSFRVRPYYNADGSLVFDSYKSEYGYFSAVFIAGTMTSKTENVNATPKSTTEISVTWDKTSGKCNGYQILLYDYTENKSYIAATVDSNVNSRILTGLTPGNNYRVAVRAYYNCNGSKVPGYYSSSCDVITYCSAPTNLKTTRLSSTSCKLAWDKMNGADGYFIYEIIDNKYVRIGLTTNNYYKITDLTAYSKHKYSIKAYKKSESKNYLSAPCKSVGVNLAEAPSRFTIPSYSDTAVGFNWNSTAGADKYVVYLYSNAGKLLRTNYVTQSSITYKNLLKNTTYKVKVKAVYGKYTSDCCAAQIISTKRSTPTNLSISSVSSTTMTLSWKKVSGATGYWIYKYNYTTKTFYKYKEVGDVSSVKLTGLTRNSAHRFYICAVKETTLKTYKSNRSASVGAWTKK